VKWIQFSTFHRFPFHLCRQPSEFGELILWSINTVVQNIREMHLGVYYPMLYKYSETFYTFIPFAAPNSTLRNWFNFARENFYIGALNVPKRHWGDRSIIIINCTSIPGHFKHLFHCLQAAANSTLRIRFNFACGNFDIGALNVPKRHSGDMSIIIIHCTSVPGQFKHLFHFLHPTQL
jgi:putative transposon-encoded protein